ncbi:MAG: hypothetical protein HRT60_03675 [Dinoroseobacter sp.]|nr:hypothetical protein [Dinoroseobacter sp.]
MSRKPHFSYWLIAATGLLWSLGGCLNYITQTSPEAVAQMPEVYQLLINGRPAWATAGFAISVFGGAVGCILLLMRRRQAVPVLALSLIGTLVIGYFTFRVIGPVSSMVMAVLMSLALLAYAIMVRRSGVLR